MKFRTPLLPLFVIFASLAWAQAQPPATPPPPPAPATPTIASVLDRPISGVERLLVGVAEAMPEDKYSFAPTSGEYKGVRTFAEQLKHVAAINNVVFSAVLGEPAPPASEQENGPAALKSKAEIAKYLQDSFVLAHRAVAAITDQNAVAPIKSPFGSGTATRLGMTTMMVGHGFDHYGQLVEYLRMNGIIPPASRK